MDNILIDNFAALEARLLLKKQKAVLIFRLSVPQKHFHHYRHYYCRHLILQIFIFRRKRNLY